MEQATTLIDPTGARVAAILASPPSPSTSVAVLCHGFLSNKNSSTNKALTRLLIERGIATLRFDFFGQGESDGPFEAITVSTAIGQAQTALAWAGAQGYTRLALAGSSFGGLVAILAAARTPTVSCLALKCPVPDFPELLTLEFGAQGMAEWSETDSIPDVTGGSRRIRLRYAFYEDCLRHSGYDAATRIVGPTLIVQGDRDELVPLDQSRRLCDLLGGPTRLEIIPGADHGFSKAEHFQTMTGLLADWLTAHLR